MAVRFDAEGEAYVGTTGLPGHTWTVTFWAMISVDRDYYSSFISIDSSSAYTEFATDLDGVTPKVYNSIMGSVQATSAMTPGTWYAMAFVLNDATSTGTLYWGTDPNALSSVTSSAGGFTPTDFRIGHYRSSGEWLNGRMAAVKLWNSVLSAPQIAIELQSYDPIVTANLLRVHKLRVPETTDYSGNGYTLTAQGAGATTEADPPIPDGIQEPGRFFLGARSSVPDTQPTITFNNRPTQPLRYHYEPGTLASSWAHPGALVIAGLARSDVGPVGTSPAYEGTNPGYVTAAAAGATVLIYIDPIIDNDWGLYHELLLHQYDSLGRTVGPAAALWPGNLTANGWGQLNDFRIGSVIQSKFGPVLNKILDECPWAAGFFIDDCGSRSWFPGFSWTGDFTDTDRAAYRAGAIALVQTARTVCDTRHMANGRRRIVLVNGTWSAGDLLNNGGGYPDPNQFGCSLAEGAMIEHPATLDQFWTDYATGSQWASEASTNGIPFIVSSHYTTAQMNDFINASIVSHAESEEASSVWGTFHETGLPDNR
jgi:hypothetical protein